MEVHHHSTHAAGSHQPAGKRKWAHYFWEFIMLFLAVFAGFLAENQREHIVEQKRAKEYAASMITDLGSDTAELKTYIAYTSFAAHNVDTLLILLSKNIPSEIPSGKLYWFGLFGGFSRPFIQNDATMHQLKSSGSLRYFSNKRINQQVAAYDQLCRKMRSLEENDISIFTEVRKIRGQIFEFRFNSDANSIAQQNYQSFDQRKIDSFIATNPPLLTYDKSLFNQYIELVRSRFMTRRLALADTLLSKARMLLNDLKKEYRLR